MKSLVEFELDGKPVFVEVEESEISGGMRRVSRGGEEGPVRAQKRFTEAIEAVKPAAEAVLNTFREMKSPDEIALEFGIKMNATAGVVFASGGSEATFKVSLKWKNEK